MHDRHQRARHASQFGVLDDVAAINDSRRFLLNELFRAPQDFIVGYFSAAAHQDGNAPGDFDHFVINRDVVGRIGLDSVRSEFDRLAH